MVPIPFINSVELKTPQRNNTKKCDAAEKQHHEEITLGFQELVQFLKSNNATKKDVRNKKKDSTMTTCDNTNAWHQKPWRKSPKHLAQIPKAFGANHYMM